MARRGTVKQLSVLHEEWVARWQGGVRSKSSGGSDHDRGDVRTPSHLIECKHTGTYDKPAKSVSVKLSDLEKIADEAWSEGKIPSMALRIYNPESVLADSNGFIDMTLHLTRDDG